MTSRKTAFEFASRLRGLIDEQNKKQRKLANELQLSSSVVNRLCKEGIGSEENICIILEKLGLKRRRMLEMLTDRRAELSEGRARNAWKHFKYAFLDEDEYLAENCPIPLDRAFACTHMGIPIFEVMQLAKSHGISSIEDLQKVGLSTVLGFAEGFEKKFGAKAKKAVLAEKCKTFPPVLLFAFKHKRNAAEYIKLTKCNGQLFFGLPHLVIGDYAFAEGGVIEEHRNTGGVELLYSMEGVFELTSQGLICQTKLRPRSSILVLDAREKHSIRLAKGKKGRLIMARFDPKRREPLPGRPMRRRRKR